MASHRMEEQEHEQQQQQQQQTAVGGPSTRKGEGYTVRLSNGKKVLKTKVLEKQIQETELQYQELLQQNQALRAKEEQQLKLLGWYDAWSRSVKSELPSHAHVAEQCASTQSDSSSALPAPERLERQSQRLLDSLRPLGPAELQDTASGPMQPSVSAAEGSGSGSGVAASTTARSAGIDASATDAQAAAAGGEDHMTRWFSQLDPAELAIFRTMTPQALAVRLRSIIARLAMARGQGRRKADLAACYDVLEDMGQVCALQVAANEKVLAQVYEMNMETLELEAFPADHWTHVMHAAKLTKQQRSALCQAFEQFSQGTEAIRQQQQSLLQELQATMGVGLPVPRAGATAAAVEADAGAAGPAHFMSLATGGPVVLDAAAAAGARHGHGGGSAATAAAATAADSLCDLLLRRDHTGTPLSADELQFLSAWLAEHKEGGAQPSSDSRSSWLAPAGVLPLADAEKAESLMEQLSRSTGGIKLCLHQLTMTFVNLLTTAQRADVVLACYPFMMDLPQFCGCVAEAEAGQQARATKALGRRQN